MDQRPEALLVLGIGLGATMALCVSQQKRGHDAGAGGELQWLEATVEAAVTAPVMSTTLAGVSAPESARVVPLVAAVEDMPCTVSTPAAAAVAAPAPARRVVAALRLVGVGADERERAHRRRGGEAQRRELFLVAAGAGGRERDGR